MKSNRLFGWVVLAILVGGTIGYGWPRIGVAMKPLGDGFIALIRMLIGPVVFLTVVLGMAGASDVRKLGRVGLKSLVYFEVMSTLALALGLLLVTVLQPGAGFHVSPRTLDSAAVTEYSGGREGSTAAQFLLHLIPKTFADAFSGNGDLLQVLLLAGLMGVALVRMGERAQPLVRGLEALAATFFGMVDLVLRLAPIGAGGAMAFTIGKYGAASIAPLLKLMGTFYFTCLVFVMVVLGSVARRVGFSIVRFLHYIGDELLLVLGTSSSEAALVPLMRKLERLGCSTQVVGLVVPSGYSFNLDGTNIYLTLATLFIAQALDVHLSARQELTVLAVAMLTSKGASGVTGAGFITLAATLTVLPAVPVAGLALILGVDRFMSGARALTNMIGNGVATIVVAGWENELDREQLRAQLLSGGPD